MIDHRRWHLPRAIAIGAALHAFVLLPLSPLVHAGDGSCRKVGESCIDGPGTRLISGLPVTRDCWVQQARFECVDPGRVIDSCQPLLDRGCGQVNSICLTKDVTGACALWENTFQCQSAGTTQQVTNCAGQLFCASAAGEPQRCFDTGYPPDRDFGRAVASLEAAREAGTYLDPKNLELFKGVADSCGIRYGGLAQCCKRNSGGGASQLSNAAMTAAMKAGNAVAQEAWKAGSPYVFDRLFGGGVDFAAQGIEAIQMLGSAGEAAAEAGTSFTLYGFEFAFSFAEGFTFVAFDPWSFALSIAIMVIVSMMQCTNEEQAFSLKLGNDLCHHVGSYCSSKGFGGVCTEQRQSYCCYNSKLARILNEQGRPQLGRGWGTPEAPECRGFTADEIQRIDFSKIDWSEFIATIQTQVPDAATLLETNQSIIDKKTKCYYAGKPC